MILSIKTKYKINDLLAITIIVFLLFFTFLSPVTRSLWLVRFCSGVVLLLLAYDRRSIVNTLPLFVFSSMVLIELYLSGRIDERGFNAPVSHVTHFTGLFSVAAMAQYMKNTDRRLKSMIIRFALSLLLISAFISLYYVLRVDVYAIRFNEGRGYMNVLRFSQTYSICIICALLLSLILYSRKNRITKAYSKYYVFMLIVYVICIFLSLFATATLLMAFGMGLTILAHYFKNKQQLIILIIAINLAILLVIAFSEQIALLIYKLTENLNWVLRLRIRGIVDIVFGTSLSPEYSMQRRSELASYSLTTFKEHPFFGIGYGKFGYGVIGMHQEWFDLLGTFGMVGAIFFLVALGIFLKSIYSHCTNALDRSGFMISVCMLFILGFLNPCLSVPVLFSVLCIAPNTSALIHSDKEKHI